MWTDQELAQITTPAVADERGVALLRTVRDLLTHYGPQNLHVQSAQDCPAELLPALIAERSMEEFIDPDLPEQIKRDILDQEYPLKKLKGYDDGVLLGMQLLGYSADIIQWHAQTPMAGHDTHILKVFVEASSEVPYSTNDVRAIKRMNTATKRWSQETELRLSVDLPSQKRSFGIGAAAVWSKHVVIEPEITTSLEADADIQIATAVNTNAHFILEAA